MNKIVKTFENFLDGPEHHEMMPHQAPHHDMEQHATGRIHQEDDHEAENYMFFGNLETIKRLIDIVLEMDPLKVDAVLKNGHNWAVDHIATAKDDIEEVADFLMTEMSDGQVDENEEADEHSMVCENCGMEYSANEDHVCEEA
jgi:hypothetical protein